MLPLDSNALRCPDIRGLGAFVAACQHHHQYGITLHELDPIAGPLVDSQLADTTAHWLDTAEVSINNMVKSHCNASLGANVTQAAVPGIESR